MWTCNGCYRNFDDNVIRLTHHEFSESMCLSCGYTCEGCGTSWYYDVSHGDEDDCHACGNSVGERPEVDFAYDQLVGGDAPPTRRIRAEQVRSYSYKPEPIFFGQSDFGLFTGVEHEMEVPGRKLEALEVIARYNEQIADAHGNKLFYVKSDGSLSGDGFEMVSHPFSPSFFAEHYPFAMLDELKELGAGPKDEHGRARAGIHIHVSRRAYTTLHLYRFMHLVYEYPLLVQKVAGRFGSGYASFDREKLGSTLRLKSDGQLVKAQAPKLRRLAKGEEVNEQRYMAINLQNRSTIELRFFRSTGKKERVKAYLQFVEASYHYTMTARMGSKGKGRSMSEADFLAYVRENEAKYPDLLALFNRTPGYEPD